MNDILYVAVSCILSVVFLAVYFDNIIPNASGVRKSVLYFLKPSHWMGKGDKKREGGVCSCAGSVPPQGYFTPDEDVLEEENIVKQQATEGMVDPNAAVQIRGLAKTYSGALKVGCCCKCKRKTPYIAVKVKDSLLTFLSGIFGHSKELLFTFVSFPIVL